MRSKWMGWYEYLSVYVCVCVCVCVCVSGESLKIERSKNGGGKTFP